MNYNKVAMIHQIFINIGRGELREIAEFNWSHDKTKIFCKNNNIPHTLWSKKNIEDLLEDYPQYKDLYYGFRYDIMRIDFARLLILYHHGGLYLDLDIYPFNGEDIKYIFDKDFFIARWNKSQLPYNAIIGCKKRDPLMKKVIDEVIRSTEEKNKIDIYHKWKARYVFQTTGHYAIHRAIKGLVEYSPVVSVYNAAKDICECCPKGQAHFMDGSASVWFDKEFKGEKMKN
jgi:mannosyltransferase OCH1-like enzyme